jgi:hypothetical protein
MSVSTSNLLANIADMQQRLFEMQQQLSANLNGRPQNRRPSGRVPYRPHDVDSHASTMNTSVPLQQVHSNRKYPQHRGEAPRQRFYERGSGRPHVASEDNDFHSRPVRRARPQVGSLPSSEEKEFTRPEPQPLSDLLQNGEEVTFQVIVGKSEEGQHVYTTAVSTFDGTQLTVTACDLVPSLVTTQSVKPGEILYKFINGLKENGNLKRSFSVAPWKLCSVQRDGQQVTLEQLRRQTSPSSSE